MSLKAVEEGDVQDAFIWRFIRVTASIRETMRATGVFGGEVFGTDSYLVLSQRRAAFARRQEVPHRQRAGLSGQRRPVHHLARAGATHPLGSAARWTPAPDVADGAWKYVGKANQNTVDGHYGLPHHLFNDMQHDFFGPYTNNYTYWLRRIKKTFDPKGVSEASNHITAKDV